MFESVSKRTSAIQLPNEVAINWFSFINLERTGQLYSHISGIAHRSIAAGQTDMLLYLFNSTSFFCLHTELGAFIARWALKDDEWDSLIAFVIFMRTWKVHISGYVCIHISNTHFVAFIYCFAICQFSKWSCRKGRCFASAALPWLWLDAIRTER